MPSLDKGRSLFSSPLAIYALGAAFIFVMGFFIHFGKEAQSSKSWKYVLPDRDAIHYWTAAKGRMMTPRCDGNPFYYEEQGTRHIIPCTAIEAVGLLSKYTHIPLSWFFPAWQILVPLFFWFVMVVCCWKFWNYPPGISAAGVLILLLSTLFCPFPGVSTTILFRFTRPMDGIALFFLWISLLFKGDPGNKKHCGTIALVSALTLWLQPYYAVFFLWITALEYLYALFKKQGFLKLRLHLCAMGSCFVFGLIYAGYAHYGKNTTAILLSARYLPPAPLLHCLMTIPVFVFIASVVCFFHLRLKREVTLLDRLMIEWSLFGIFVYFASTKVPSAREAPIHMLYFVPVILFSMAGWIYEKLCALKEARLFLQFSHAFMFFSVVFLVSSVIIRKNLFSSVSAHYYVYITQYFLISLFIFWLFERFEFLRKVVMRKKNICVIILLIAIAGYWRIPVNRDSRNYPFDGGYQWLEHNAKKNAVVLTASVKYRYCDYLFLTTGLKSYYHPTAYILAEAPVQTYRKNFVTSLLLGLLDKMPDYGGWPLEQKLRAFKLDYILMPKPSPFFEAVTTQLGGHLHMVYQDQKCWLWKVS